LAELALDYAVYRASLEQTIEEMAASGELLLGFAGTDELVDEADGEDPCSPEAVHCWLASLDEGDLVLYQGSLDAAELVHRASAAAVRALGALGLDVGPSTRDAEKLAQAVRGAVGQVVGSRGNLWLVATEAPGGPSTIKASLEVRRVAGVTMFASPAAETLLRTCCLLAVLNDGYFFVADQSQERGRCYGWHVTMGQTSAVTKDEAEMLYRAFGMGADIAPTSVELCEPGLDDLSGTA
jgi:hypothetical protein